MIIVCSHCSARLQLDETKVPSRSFTVRCPKCQQAVQIQPPRFEQDERERRAEGSAPREARPIPAPAFNLETAQPAPRSGASEPTSELAGEELLNALARLLRGEQAGAVAHRRRRQRRVLLCVEQSAREPLARALSENNYEVYIAANTSQAIERMREDQMDVLVLDAEFDAAEQGAAFIAREIKALRPAERRRLFFVQISPTLRTGDAHVAFLHNINLAVNSADIRELPSLLDYTIRSYNELYKDYFAALQLAPL